MATSQIKVENLERAVVENKNQGKNGRWNDNQHNSYVVFIDFFKRELNSKQKRRNNKIFKLMSVFLKNKTPIQCRSHHIKLMRTFKTIDKIKKNLVLKLGLEEYQTLFSQVVAKSPIFIQFEKEKLKEKKTLVDSKIFEEKSSPKDVGCQTDLAFMRTQEPQMWPYMFNENSRIPNFLETFQPMWIWTFFS